MPPMPRILFARRHERCGAAVKEDARAVGRDRGKCRDSTSFPDLSRIFGASNTVTLSVVDRVDD